MSENGVDHPIDPGTVVEYDHPDDDIGQSEGEVWDCWTSVEEWVYEILDQNFEKVRIDAQDITEVRDGDLRADGSGEPADGAYRECPDCGHEVVLSERAVQRLGDFDIGCAECDTPMKPPRTASTGSERGRDD